MFQSIAQNIHFSIIIIIILVNRLYLLYNWYKHLKTLDQLLVQSY